MKKAVSLLLALLLAASLPAPGVLADEPEEPVGDPPAAERVEIDTAEALFAFAARVNDGETALDAVLTDDIDLGGKPWTPIGTGDNKFSGTFDGGGNIISGLYIATGRYVGLFGYVSGGTVENLAVAGYVHGVSYAAAIVAVLSDGGAISDCVNYAEVSGSQGRIGGVAGDVQSGSKVSRCANYGAVSCAGRYTRCGGIAGEVSGATLSECANFGAVYGEYTYASNGPTNVDGVGGVSGWVKTSTVEYCYNAAGVYLLSKSDRVGGIAGDCEVTRFQYCFDFGPVTGVDKNGGTSVRAGALVGLTGGKFDTSVAWYNCYLSGAAAAAIGSTTGNYVFDFDLLGTVEKSADQFRSLVADGFLPSGYYTDGADFPLLNWQASDAAAQRLVVTPADAAVTLDGVPLDPARGGVYTLSPGSHSYEIARAGYYSDSGYTTAGYGAAAATLTRDTRSTAVPGGTIYGDGNEGQPNNIVAGGTYTLGDGATGTVFINTAEPVTIVGKGTDDGGKFTALGFKAQVEGIDLTVRDLYIYRADTTTATGTAGAGGSIIAFAGTGNRLHFEGTSMFEAMTYVQSAVIHVGKGGALTIDGGTDGSGVLYMYKATQGAGFGGSTEEAGGSLTFNSGTYYLKGNATGAIIGGDAVDGTLNDDITINGGIFNMQANARGAAIGGSAEGTCAGTVRLKGGNVTITVDYSGSAIGNGDKQAGGTLAVSGGSLKTYITENAADTVRGGGGWGVQGVSDKCVTSERRDASGATVYPLAFDTDGFNGGAFTVYVDGAPFYSGGRHTTDWRDSQVTKDNWTASDDTNLYFYLSGKNHVLTVSDGAQSRDYDVVWSETDKSFTYHAKEAVAYAVTFTGSHATAYVGGVARSSISLEAGKTLTFTAGASAGYEIGGVTATDGTLFKNANGSWTLGGVTGDVTVVLTAAPKAYRVEFALTPSNALLTVRDASGAVVAPLTGNVYPMVHGRTYAYIASLEGYADRGGELTAGEDFYTDLIGDNAIPVILSPLKSLTRAEGSTSWDGTSVDTEWSGAGTASDPYIIASAAELAGLAYSVNLAGAGNSAFPGVWFELAADIDLMGYEWTSIGGGEAQCGFAGHFDGGGHVVSNLYIRSTASWTGYEGRNRGLFGIIDAGGVVENLGVGGSVYAQRSVGGVAGKNSGTIRYCYNAATVTGTDSKGVGGIVGANWNQGTVSDCYNVGTVSSVYANGSAGGIAGENEYLISRCYNAARVTSPYNAGGIVGSDKNHSAMYTTGTCTDCFYLNDIYTGSYTGGIGDVADGDGNTIKAVGSATLKALPGSLGRAFRADADNINSGYPVLTWQKDVSVGGDPVDNVVEIKPQQTPLAAIGVAVGTTIIGTTAVVGVDSAALTAAAAEADGNTVLVIAPELEEDVEIDAVEASVEAAALVPVAESGASVRFETPMAAVTFGSAALKDLTAAEGEIVLLYAKRNEDESVTIKISAGTTLMHELSGGIRVELPAAADRHVLVLVDAEGTETVLKKSLVESGTACVTLPGSATVKAVDNTKTFADVAGGAWYAGAVDFASSHELFEGDGTSFMPQGNMTRAMMATVLYRLEDAKEDGGTAVFSDVPAGEWYTDAVAWANESGIIAGYGGGMFGTGDDVTREQMATIFYRYAGWLKMDTSASVELDTFPDGGDTSAWALEAMGWAVAAGLFEGDDAGALDPGGNATRAEVAALFQRMVGLIVK